MIGRFFERNLSFFSKARRKRLHFFVKYSNINRRLNERLFAEMSEWFKEHDWKSCDAGTYPEVQILFSAPKHPILGCFLFLKKSFDPTSDPKKRTTT